MMTVSDQPVACVGADEPGPAGNKDPHRRPFEPGAARGLRGIRRACSSAVAAQVNLPARLGPAARRCFSSTLQAPTIASARDSGSRVGQQCCTTCRFRHGADVRGDDRASAGHGLQDRQPEGLIERRIHEYVSRAIEVDGLLECHSAYPYDIVGDTQLVSELNAVQRDTRYRGLGLQLRADDRPA